MPSSEQSSSSQNPTISVIMAVFNGEKYLAEAIESILAQTYQDFELILIDDGSTDRTHEIVESYSKIDYLYQENQGVAAARNKGLRIAKGKFLTFLDADDLWVPEKLALQLQAFEKNPELEIVTGYLEQFISPELSPATKARFRLPEKAIKGYAAGAMMIRREVFEKTGPFHEDFSVGETISWISNVLELDLKIVILPQIIIRRRIHGNNLSIVSQNEKGKTIARILKSTLDRRRKAQVEKDGSESGEQRK